MPGAFSRFLIASVLLMGFSVRLSAQHRDNIRFVDPFIGTAKSNVPTKWGNEGGTYPGAVAPSGAIQLSPETKAGKGYDYTDSTICYFSCYRHFCGFPGGSAGRFQVMPVSGVNDLEPRKYSRRFSHKSEMASPGYYQVVFDDDHTRAEATATTRTGMFRFTFPATVMPRIFIGDAGDIRQQSKRILQFSRGNTVVNLNVDYSDLKKVSGGWIVSFTNEKTITLKISASTIGVTGAQKNIDQEIGDKDFDAVRRQTQEEWGKKLSIIDISDRNEQNKTIFYTALYHSLLIPWVVDDADGQYLGADGQVHKKSGQNQYGGFSPWDTFRSLNPLLTLLYPDKENDIILSMLDIYKQTGHLPTESMTGNHAIPVIVDSYLKGVDKFDKELAYNAMKSNIVDTPFLQGDMEAYHQSGYIPYTHSESVTRTVEYAYDDWALSQYARQIVHDDSDFKLLHDRGFNYRNLLNVNELFLLPRNKNEFKIQPGMSGYKEGDQWVYSYFVPHNMRDLINLLGGNDQFAARLDSALTHNVILFDNETVFHIPYLFNQAGKTELTQKWVRKIMQERFSDAPGGLPGNDDLGSTSSWYVFSAIGIYPVCPGRPLYAIGSPLFESATLNLPNGKKFIINSFRLSVKDRYVNRLFVNGQPWHHLTLSHATLTAGGKMIFDMDNKPAKSSSKINTNELSETASYPVFKISGFSATKKAVEPDELFFLKFSISNTGSAGTKTVDLIVNKKVYARKNCLVASGKALVDSIPCRLYPTGETTLQIAGLPPLKVRVKSPDRPVAQCYKITAYSATPLVKLHNTQRVSYTIQNTGGAGHAFTIPVMSGDSLVFDDKVMLAPGEKKIVNHDMVAGKPGFQYVKIGSNKIPYKVYQYNRESVLLDLSPQYNDKDTLVNDMSGLGNKGRIIFVADHTKTPDNRLLFGKNCFIELPSSPGLDELGETITMMAWVYPTSSNSGLTDIFTKGDTNVLQVAEGKSLTFFAGGWGRGDCTVDLPPHWLNHWHHIAGVCEGRILHVYIDGILKGTTTTDQTANLSVNNKWVLGRNDEFPSEREFQGYIGNVKIYKEPLSAEEVLAVFSNDRTLMIK
ncbi:GH92 family glycosyl hydrolase [Mucilaginibacter ginsenosidivorans]|uniref:LamG-like jellyroll fold domain-containing protein n=1 Tax=Mucilaginibacter ginsenosidivorans TaxID=398053 RepID=A0A5B8UY55_9SPHI|nr:GH92 family glycosyl hydrolase [Mucilaginibacter ginsenosidivorans]QEC63326.1 hypothetical protein FRZ54_12310 [Mucilaginibacter ginsenosidivorans]